MLSSNLLRMGIQHLRNTKGYWRAAFTTWWTLCSPCSSDFETETLVCDKQQESTAATSKTCFWRRNVGLSRVQRCNTSNFTEGRYCILKRWHCRFKYTRVIKFYHPLVFPSSFCFSSPKVVPLNTRDFLPACLPAWLWALRQRKQKIKFNGAAERCDHGSEALSPRKIWCKPGGNVQGRAAVLNVLSISDEVSSSEQLLGVMATDETPITHKIRLLLVYVLSIQLRKLQTKHPEI